ncbi:GAF and ANTAR domain-containing protein [Amycolatopsis sp. DG1A-15b]|uniref:GAF and ANTAR domain-containing protein n=1 Tax=Amycolatopsis sp. DG1A-15b TaxID=3052846 RepID=UPI00255B50EB|nr:GAF and ANTAR domain-containing protein [Amycolatopsis sp. DG1A-15b]WIX92353.1 GAF and ANTAR domain-containing protein [Amycolatopsis sp. DG1A-15b]
MEYKRDTEAWPEVLDEVTGALDTLTSALDSEDDFTVLLRQVCKQVTRAVPGVDEATITLLTGGVPVTAASTSDIVTALDHDQYTVGDGPCLRASRTGKMVRVSITDAADLWPTFAKDSAAQGFSSFLSAPLVISDGHNGAVNCYSARGNGFADLDEKLLDLYTSAITAALRAYRRYQQAHETTEQLREALTSRAVIDQAKGILMALRQIPADEAFRLLVEQSQRENVKLRDLAGRFIAHATGVPPTP